MTKEDKELLLKDLCARLPYGVKVQVYDNRYAPTTLTAIDIKRQECIFNFKVPVENCLQYLRPMYSITDKEKEELKEIGSEYLEKWENAQDSIDKWRLDAEVACKRSEFYNSHLLDWCGLIQKGLAIEAPKDMYNLNK